MNIQTAKLPTHFRGISVGWGNGYVGVPNGHPWFGKDYDAINAEVHGGLTYASDCVPTQKPDGRWWVGFDTAHCGDTPDNCTEDFVDSEIQRLKQQAELASV